MAPNAIDVEADYRRLIEAMTVVERVARAEALFRWIRDYHVRAILSEHGPLSTVNLKRAVAHRLYDDDPLTKALIDELPTRVSG